MDLDTERVAPTLHGLFIYLLGYWKSSPVLWYREQFSLVRRHQQGSAENAHRTRFCNQDGAPGHKAAETKEDLRERGIYPIFWPAYSPDLNLIETVWNRMKDWIMKKYLDYHTSYNRLRIAVKEAWDAIGELELLALVREIPARCQAVINANGMHTKYGVLDRSMNKAFCVGGDPCWWRRTNENCSLYHSKV
jgi:transposase